MDNTASTNAATGQNNFLQPTHKPKQATCLTTFKKIIYFLHFIIIAIWTTYILIRYPHARQISFTLFALIVYGYMVVWTILLNFIFLTFGKQNWAVMFDRLFIKFFMMLWPICAIISYVYESFLNITQVAVLVLYMSAISVLLIFYEIYACTFAQHENPKFIFQQNDLKQSDDIVWQQRKLYNQSIINKNNINIDA